MRATFLDDVDESIDILLVAHFVLVVPAVAGRRVRADLAHEDFGVLEFFVGGGLVDDVASKGAPDGAGAGDEDVGLNHVGLRAALGCEMRVSLLEVVDVEGHDGQSESESVLRPVGRSEEPRWWIWRI